MKKLLFIGALVLIGVCSVYWYQIGIPQESGQENIHKITIEGHVLSVEFARTPQAQQRGLMYRAELAEDSGMLFLFTRAGQQTFWNKNTLIPLDIIWIHDDIVIGISQLPAISEGLTTVSSPTDANRVLEVNRGWAEQHHIQIGARIW
ncbi:MAG: DUF192 domain-containing protein [Patescibacteria group bacterium]